MLEMIRLTMGTAAKVVSSLVIALLIALGVYLAANHEPLGDRVIYVVSDTCSYELASAISSYSDLRGVIVNHREIDSAKPRIGRDTVVVLLYTNISGDHVLDYVLSVLNESTSIEKILATDIAQSRIQSRHVILNDDIWLYCMQEDHEALERVVERVKEVVEEPRVQAMEIPLVSISLLASAVVLSVIVYMDEISNMLRESIRKTISLLASIALYLGLRIDRSRILDHPLRQEIYRQLLENGDVSFSELMNKLNCSRATLEWHLSLLIRAGIVQEYRKGRARYYRLLSKIATTKR